MFLPVLSFQLFFHVCAIEKDSLHEFALPISRLLGLLSVLGLQWGQKGPRFLTTFSVRLALYAWASGGVLSKKLFPIPMATTFPPGLLGKHTLCSPQQLQTCLYWCRTSGRLWGLLLRLSQKPWLLPLVLATEERMPSLLQKQMGLALLPHPKVLGLCQAPGGREFFTQPPGP